MRRGTSDRKLISNGAPNILSVEENIISYKVASRLPSWSRRDYLLSGPYIELSLIEN